MEQKIKLQLTEQEAKALKSALLNERQDIALMIKKAPASILKPLQDRYCDIDKILGLINEPYLV